MTNSRSLRVDGYARAQLSNLTRAGAIFEIEMALGQPGLDLKGLREEIESAISRMEEKLEELLA